MNGTVNGFPPAKWIVAGGSSKPAGMFVSFVIFSIFRSSHLNLQFVDQNRTGTTRIG